MTNKKKTEESLEPMFVWIDEGNVTFVSEETFNLNMEKLRERQRKWREVVVE